MTSTIRGWLRRRDHRPPHHAVRRDHFRRGSYASPIQFARPIRNDLSVFSATGGILGRASELQTQRGPAEATITATPSEARLVNPNQAPG